MVAGCERQLGGVVFVTLSRCEHQGGQCYPAFHACHGSQAERSYCQFQLWLGAVDRYRSSPFCTTKWTIEGLTKALAQELPQGRASLILICYALLLGHKLTIFLPPRNGLKLRYLGDSTLALKNNGLSLTVGKPYKI